MDKNQICSQEKMTTVLHKTLPLFYEYLIFQDKQEKLSEEKLSNINQNKKKDENNTILRKMALGIFIYDAQILVEKYPTGFTDGAHLFLHYSHFLTHDQNHSQREVNKNNLEIILNSIDAINLKPGQTTNGIERITTQQLILALAPFPEFRRQLSLSAPDNIARVLAIAQNNEYVYIDINEAAEEYIEGVLKHDQAAEPTIFEEGMNATHRAYEAAVAIKIGQILQEKIKQCTVDSDFIEKSTTILSLMQPHYLTAAIAIDFKINATRQQKTAYQQCFFKNSHVTSELFQDYEEMASGELLRSLCLALEGTTHCIKNKIINELNLYSSFNSIGKIHAEHLKSMKISLLQNLINKNSFAELNKNKSIPLGGQSEYDLKNTPLSDFTEPFSYKKFKQLWSQEFKLKNEPLTNNFIYFQLSRVNLINLSSQKGFCYPLNQKIV